jgi:hypothetical protein
MLLQVACTFAPIWGSPARRGPYGDDGGAVVVVVGAVVGGLVVGGGGGVVVGTVVVGEVAGGAAVVVDVVGAAFAAGAGDAGGVLNGPHAASSPHPTRTTARRWPSPKLRTPCLSADANSTLMAI